MHSESAQGIKVMYNYYYIPAKKFSSHEIRELLISVAVLTVAFSIAFSKLTINMDIVLFTFFLPVALLIVSTAFVLHELGHKLVAQKYGCWAEYRMYPRGLLLALLFSFFGVVFAAPGAVYIAGNVDSERNGKISLAGPGVNVLISLFALPLLFLPGFVGFIGFYLGYINIFLALFNMIPFYPLDGSKVFRWNKKIYAFALIGMIILFAFYLVFS